MDQVISPTLKFSGEPSGAGRGNGQITITLPGQNEDDQSDEKDKAIVQVDQRPIAYDEVCTQCKDAWTERRFKDIGVHTKSLATEMRNEDCLLWKVMSNGSLGTLKDKPNSSPAHSVEDYTVDQSCSWEDSIFYNSSPEPTQVSEDVRIVPESKIYLPLVKSWLSTCEAGHAECNKPRFADAALTNARFLLIDVHAHQVVPASLGTSRFIALSYVWGDARQLQLSESLFPELSKPGGLKQYEAKIPQTIKDAMSVVSSLGEKHLWVDSLCILQDNASEKQSQIAQMAAIYDAALLTIVACTATSANDPLPGIQPGTRIITKQITRQRGILFAENEMSMLMFDLPEVSHSQRAWTFQEVLLSRRCLFFFGGEVMMQCQKSLFKESSARVDSPGAMNQTGNWPPIERPPVERSLVSIFFRYRAMVMSYTGRALTFEKDRKDAFTGVTRALELAWKWNFDYGLPAEEMDWALLWTGQYASDEATQWKEKERELKREQGFPTWSWLSHSGLSLYLIEKESAGTLKSYIGWQYTSIWDGVKSYAILSREMSSEGTVQLVKDYPPGTLIILGFVKHLSYIAPSAGAAEDEMRKEMKEQASYGTPCAPLIDAEGNWYGTLNGITEGQFAKMLLAEGAELSLVQLSTVQNTWILGGFRKSKAPYDVEKYEKGEFKTFNVMLVRWDDRLATRVAVGEIHRSAWESGESEADIIRLI